LEELWEAEVEHRLLQTQVKVVEVLAGRDLASPAFSQNEGHQAQTVHELVHTNLVLLD
jgi:hypothetical protein